MAINVGSKYQFTTGKTDPAPGQKVLCTKTGISKPLSLLTDADIVAMMAKGNTNFSLRPTS